MSGTSLDGLDLALCKIKGSGFNTSVELKQFESIPYPPAFIEDIRSVFSKRQVDLEKLTLLNAHIADIHAEIILACLQKWNTPSSEIDCIASHGQTIYHAPKRLHQQKYYPNATLQIGDGDHIAVKTGIITLSDFRQKHIASGGEGAPLALYGDAILFSSNTENRVLLNIGGISNFTFLPSNRSQAEIVSTDAGPGNTLIDALAKKHFDVPYDDNGELARRGKANESLLKILLSHPFFGEHFPKTTGPELFNLAYFDEAIKAAGAEALNSFDLIATATEFTVRAISEALNEISGLHFSVYVSGGGSRNSYLIERLQKLLASTEIKLTEALGINPDAKEAVLFALLANETLCGSAVTTGAGPVTMMGKISLPS